MRFESILFQNCTLIHALTYNNFDFFSSIILVIDSMQATVTIFHVVIFSLSVKQFASAPALVCVHGLFLRVYSAVPLLV